MTFNYKVDQNRNPMGYSLLQTLKVLTEKQQVDLTGAYLGILIQTLFILHFQCLTVQWSTRSKCTCTCQLYKCAIGSHYIDLILNVLISNLFDLFKFRYHHPDHQYHRDRISMANVLGNRENLIKIKHRRLCRWKVKQIPFNFFAIPSSLVFTTTMGKLIIHVLQAGAVMCQAKCCK